MKTSEIFDTYLLANREKLLDIAAFLDRLDRAADQPQESDFRKDAIKEALRILVSDTSSKVEQIQMLLSDPTTEPLEDLTGVKPACGVYGGNQGDSAQ